MKKHSPSPLERIFAGEKIKKEELETHITELRARESERIAGKKAAAHRCFSSRSSAAGC